MQFFYTPDTCALASLICLIEAEAPFELCRIDFASEQQKSEAYLRINPKARVPALKVGSEVLTETPAILAYIAQAFPEAALAPSDALAFAQVQAFNSYLCSTLHVAHAHRMRGYRWADDHSAIEAMKAKVPQSVAACYTYIEQAVFEGPFVFGDAFTIADPYLFTIAQWMESDGVDPAGFPKLAAHRDRLRQRPSVVRALQEETT
ncbi:glutathione S-transferase family protein [Algihabitans albus]|uniref:glutathione S-transferase family protein n=1 Tax=Algihabitans albus TaxID=2164067 RepID=UPI0035CEDF59